MNVLAGRDLLDRCSRLRRKTRIFSPLLFYLQTFFSGLANNFGWPLIIMLSSANFSRGSLARMVDSGQLPYYKVLLHTTGPVYQALFIVANTPWSMKSMIGALSDTAPLFGFHKRSYIVLSSVVGTLALLLAGTVPLAPSQAPIAAFLFLCANYQVATVDLLCQAKYAEVMAQNPTTGSDIVTYVWALSNLGSFLGSTIAGPVADFLNPRITFLICVPLAFQVIIPALLGYLPEKRVPKSNRFFRIDKVRRNRRVFFLGFLMTLSACCLALVSLVGSTVMQVIFALASSTVLCILALLCLPTLLGRASLYLLLSSALYVSLPGALDYFYTADDKCVPNGPHFDFTYYITYTSMAGSLAGALGVVAFQVVLSKGTFRQAFWTTSAVKLTASFVDIILIQRLNTWWHIPDKSMFMLGHAIVLEASYMLDMMPAVVLTSKVCPKGLESTTYALLAGFQNFGTAVARSLGISLIQLYGIRTTAPCNFDNLGKLVIVAHVILPLLVVPLVRLLVPNAAMTDNLLENSGTHVPLRNICRTLPWGEDDVEAPRSS